MRAVFWLYFCRQLSSCSHHKAIQPAKVVLEDSGIPDQQSPADWLALWKHTQDSFSLFSVWALRSSFVQINYVPVASDKAAIHWQWRNQKFERLFDHRSWSWLAWNVPLLPRDDCASCEAKHKCRRRFPRRRICPSSRETHTDYRTTRITDPTFFNAQILKLSLRTEHQLPTFEFPRKKGQWVLRQSKPEACVYCRQPSYGQYQQLWAKFCWWSLFNADRTQEMRREQKSADD